MRACVPFATIGGFKLASVQPWICRVGEDDGNGVERAKGQIAVRARKNGRYSYQIFTVAAEPKTLWGSRRHRSYASPAEAAKAGLEAADCSRGDRIRRALGPPSVDLDACHGSSACRSAARVGSRPGSETGRSR
jgi:hypothetical protein